MNSKSYSLNIVLRMIFLAISMLVFFYSLHQEKWYVTTSVSGLLIPVLAISLVQYTHRFRRELSNFLLAIQNREYSQYQREALGKRSASLQHAFHVISRELQNVSIEKEAHYHYLRAIVENITIGIISARQTGEIHLFNKCASDLLNMPVARNMETIQKYHKQLYVSMLQMKPGERRLMNLDVDEGIRKLAIQSKEFRQQGNQFKLFSLQDIKSELDAQEVYSYQKLIQVLRHEIMNSATPISSLSEAVKESVEDLLERSNSLDSYLEEELSDLLVSTQTIHTRTRGLLNFVNNYRKLTNLPEPSFEKVHLREVINHSLTLLQSQITKEEVTTMVDIPEETATIRGDFDQVEQVVINILLNAIEALKGIDGARIEIATHQMEGGRIMLQLRDNGIGIKDSDIDQVFVPFYTTKKQGSGIGLSLARQIMKLHQGDIQLYPAKDAGAIVELYFHSYQYSH